MAGTEDNVINQRNPIPDPALVDVSDLERTINAEFTGDFEAALTKLLDDPEYERIQELASEMPNSFNQCSFTTWLNDEQYQDFGYEYTENLFMHNIRWRPVATAHVNIKGIRDIQEHVYKGCPPNKNEFTVVVAVDKQWGDVMSQHYGQLKRMSPEQPVFALILAAAAANTRLTRSSSAG